jgi:hypothetical protein
MRHICKFIALILLTLCYLAALAAGQNTVTTAGGTVNAVPKFTGSTTIGNSAISESGGSVGIGTASPANQLSIQASDTQLGIWSDTGNGFAAIDAHNVANTIKRPLVFNAWGGNVGIGTATPAHPLDVRVSTIGGIIYAKTSSTDGRITVGDSTQDWSWSSGWAVGGDFSLIEEGTAGDRIYVKRGTGYVGIGTTSPQYKLDVNGYIRARGAFVFPDGTFQTTAASGGGTITGVLPGSGLSGGGYSGNVTLGVDSTVARTTVSQSFTGNQTIWGNLAMGITNGSGGGLSANGGAWVSNNYGGTPFYIVCAGLGGTCWTINTYGNSANAGNINTYSLAASYSISAPIKNFKIDHPADPANMYMYHSSVESSEMKNYYDGVVELDDRGEAWVLLPKWFQLLNRDFRYGLTAIGAPGPNLYIAEEVANNQFKISGGQPGMKVSWSITGARQDAYAKAHPLVVEVEKPEDEKGFYIDATVFGEPATKSLLWRDLNAAAGQQPPAGK